MSDALRSFLRFGSQMVELGKEPLTIGRAQSCDVTLDDDLCSREHCRVRLDGDRVTVTDLESRNGVLLNGQRVQGEAELRHGDCIAVGREQFVLVRLRRAPPDARQSSHPPIGSADTKEDTSSGSVFEILSGGSRRALHKGDLVGAESAAGSYFVALRTAVVRGTGGLSRATLRDAVELGLGLAEAAQSSSWLDQVLELAATASLVIDERTMERLCALVRIIGPPRRAAKEYLRMLGRVAPADTGGHLLMRAIGTPAP